MRRFLGTAILVLVLASGCGFNSDNQTAPTPTTEPTTATTPVPDPTPATPTPTADPTPATPTPTADPTPATPTPTAEPTPATPTPTAEPTPDRCGPAHIDLAEAEAEARSEFAIIDNYLSNYEWSMLRIHRLPNLAIDGSHVSVYQEILSSRGLATFDNDILQLVTKWQHTWTLAESFSDNAKYWGEARSAAIAVVANVRKQLNDSETSGIIVLPAYVAASLAGFRASWIKSLETNVGDEKINYHNSIVYFASGAYSYITKAESLPESITGDEFVASLKSALVDVRIAQSRVNRYC